MAQQEPDIAALARLQRALLARAVELHQARRRPGLLHVLARAGGRHRRGPRSARARAGRAPGADCGRRARRARFARRAVGELITESGDLQTLPCHLPDADPRMSGLDGFYAARLQRVS